MADNNILASNLAQLGGQIASTFQNVALQNQYKNSLPAMQQVFQQSMTDFDSGRSGAGFARIMDVAMQNPNNPYIQNMAQMAFKAGQLASDDYFKKQQIDISRQKANGTSRGLTQEDIDAYMNFGKVQGGGQGGGQGQGAVQGQGQGQGAVPTQSDTEQGTEIVDTPWLSELGLNIGAVQGPKKFKVQVPKGTTETMGVNRLGATRSKSQTTDFEERNTKEADDFKNSIEISRKSASLIKSNEQLNKIWNSSNKDLNNIKLDESGNDKIGFVYTATVTDNKGKPIGKPESLSATEYNALNSLKQIPDYVSNSGGRIKLIPSSKERFPVREQAPTQPAEQPAGQQVVAPAQPATQVSAPSKPAEFSNEQNPFFEAAQRSQVSSASKGGGRAGRTGGGRAKQIQAEIDSIDERIKTIENRRGSPQDKYRAFEMLSAERKKLQSELSKFSK